MRIIIISLLLLVTVGCATDSSRRVWKEEVAHCTKRGGKAVIASESYPRYISCLSIPALERLERRELACLRAGNLPRYRGEIVGYGRIMNSCRQPDNAKIKIDIR